MRFIAESRARSPLLDLLGLGGALPPFFRIPLPPPLDMRGRPGTDPLLLSPPTGIPPPPEPLLESMPPIDPRPDPMAAIELGWGWSEV